MSHEIRTPMNAIQGTVELLRRSGLQHNQIKMVEMIDTSNKALLNLLNDILDLSKIEDGKLKIETDDFNLSLLLSSLMDISIFKAKDKNLVMDLSLDDTIPLLIHGDQFRLRQILWNLISNAIKFTDKGSIYVAVKQIKAASKLVCVEFSIRDTGVGITKENLPMIFDPFVQVDSSMSRKQQGTGLGLAITKKLVDLMGGIISVESEENNGSCFSVELTFGGANHSVSEDNDSITHAPTRFSILLVEDEPVSQTIVESLLADEGYQVTVASSGIEALEKVADNPIDIILMDLRMPGMDGLEATRRIRDMSDPKLAGIKIVAFTGDVMKETVQKCYDVGMDGVIAKPIDIHEVNKVLARLTK